MEIPFSEILCYIEKTTQLISAVPNLTRFCLMWGSTEINFRTHLRAIFVLCILFSISAFAMIYLTVTLFSIIEVLSYQEGFQSLFFRCQLA